MNSPETPTRHADQTAPSRDATGPDVTAPDAGPSRSPRWVTPAAAIACGVLVVAAVTLPRHAIDTVPSLRWQARTAVPRHAAIAPAATAGASPVPVTAVRLLHIADHLTAAPYEAHPLRFNYVEVRRWEAEPTTASTPPASRPSTSIRHLAAWTDNQGRGRSYALDETHDCTPERDDMWSQPEAAPWDGPLSSAPEAVRRQLLGPPPERRYRPVRPSLGAVRRPGRAVTDPPRCAAHARQPPSHRRS
jgi:hypothetical protein